MALVAEFLGMRDIMDRVVGYLETGDNLSISIDRARGFQEPLSGFAVPVLQEE